ncbi:MAG: tetratricopeptide repeat protein [Deltaproteobacteria bacterium]|nr:tetratricopeptide repeat protein [Deltaproteobacteria bacterium]
MALANRAAHYSDEARLRALGPTVLALRSSARSAGGGAQAAGALAELIVLTAAWLPADEEARRRWSATALARAGVIPEAVWAAALLRRAERLLNAPQAVDQREGAEAVLRELATFDLDPRLNAERYSWVGRLADQRGEPAEALSAHQTAAAEFAALGDEHGRAVALSEIADLLEARGELDEALRIRREEVLPVVERFSDVLGRANTMGKIADVLEARGDLDEALRIRQQEQLPVYERVGDIRERAVTLGQIADTLRRRGQLDEAMRIYRDELLPVYMRIGDLRAEAVAMSRIADMLQARGELDEALRIRREEVLPVLEHLGDRQGKAATQSLIADVLRARGEHDEALRIYRDEVLPIMDSLGAVRHKAMVMGKIAEALQARGDHDEALRILREETLPILSARRCVEQGRHDGEHR